MYVCILCQLNRTELGRDEVEGVHLDGLGEDEVQDQLLCRSCAWGKGGLIGTCGVTYPDT